MCWHILSITVPTAISYTPRLPSGFPFLPEGHHLISLLAGMYEKLFILSPFFENDILTGNKCLGCCYFPSIPWRYYSFVCKCHEESAIRQIVVALQVIFHPRNNLWDFLFIIDALQFCFSISWLRILLYGLVFSTFDPKTHVFNFGKLSAFTSWNSDSLPFPQLA